MSTEIKSNNASSRAAWNKGRLVGQKRPLRPKEVWAIRVRLQINRRKRDWRCSTSRKTGNLPAVQLLLGHTKIESTVRYLGIEVDDALSLSEQVEL
jgi:hypothetical protein